MKTSGSDDEPAETKDNSEETIKTEDPSDDPARIKALIHEESTHPIAVCLSIQDKEDGDIYKEFTGKQIMDLSEKALESQSSPNLEDEPKPLDCVREIRDLVVEVIEIEDMVQSSKDNGEKVQVQTIEEQDACSLNLNDHVGSGFKTCSPLHFCVGRQIVHFEVGFIIVQKVIFVYCIYIYIYIYTCICVCVYTPLFKCLGSVRFFFF